jgi:hypothetical protein
MLSKSDLQRKSVPILAKWHHGVPSDEKFSRAMSELEAAAAALT